MFPSAQGFHDGRDPRRERYLGDEFAGIDSFPFASTEISLLAVHDLLIHLAQTLLGSNDLRIYSAESWAKYTGAADYDQNRHRDYLGHPGRAQQLGPLPDAATGQPTMTCPFGYL